MRCEDSRQYLVWDEDAEETEEDFCTSELFRAAERDDLDAEIGCGGRKTTQKLSKSRSRSERRSKKAKKKSKKSKPAKGSKKKDTKKKKKARSSTSSSTRGASSKASSSSVSVSSLTVDSGVDAQPKAFSLQMQVDVRIDGNPDDRS